MKSGIRIIRSLLAQWNRRQDALAATLVEEQARQEVLLVRSALRDLFASHKKLEPPGRTAP